MQHNLNNVKVLFPTALDIDRVRQLSSLQPFGQDAVGLLNALSQNLTNYPRIREFPDVATFAFFCRKANILKFKEQYIKDNLLRLGRGIIFHIAPSNVPINFAYSLVCGILSGNVNVVRVPSPDFEQINIICHAISELADKGDFNEITDRTILVRYDRQNTATEYFSSLCDVRVIWGGDDTIAQIRKSSIPSRAFDVTFADRYSLCLINADSYIEEQNQAFVASGFYNDTYLSDQNACTSPHLLVWTGSDKNVGKSREIFWENLREVIKQKHYQLEPIIATDKLTALYSQAINSSGMHKVLSPDNLLWRIELDRLPVNIDEFHSSGGYFAEFHAASLSDLSSIINRKYQTLAYYGFSKSDLTRFMQTHKPSGIDRIVPIGRTTDFSLIWDGYDLIRTLSRVCEII